MDQRKKIRSGLPGLDEIIDHLRIGDNVVLQVDNIADYESFVLPFVRTSLDEGRKVIYMRFARHSPIIDDNENVKVYHIDAEHGFEAFSTQVHQIIAAEGEEAFYVFDCLSDLLYTWATDLMIGNFFQITCPYLYELKTVAFFAIYKNMNSYETISAIRETTQVLMNIYNVRGQTYIHPVKVIDRYSPTMFLPHIKQAQDFIPLTSSSDASKLFADMSLNVFDAPRRHLDYWDRMFLKASDTYEKVKFSRMPSAEGKNLVEKLCRMVLSRDERFLELLTKVFTLEDLLQIKSSLIGSGFIGGKAVGMLLARKILLEDENFDYKKFWNPMIRSTLVLMSFTLILLKMVSGNLEWSRENLKNIFLWPESLKAKYSAVFFRRMSKTIFCGSWSTLDNHRSLSAPAAFWKMDLVILLLENMKVFLYEPRYARTSLS